MKNITNYDYNLIYIRTQLINVYKTLLLKQNEDYEIICNEILSALCRLNNSIFRETLLLNFHKIVENSNFGIICFSQFKDEIFNLLDRYLGIYDTKNLVMIFPKFFNSNKNICKNEICNMFCLDENI